MKRTFLVVTILIGLCSSYAYAESIATRIGVPNKVDSLKFTTGSGETVIRIDAVVEMPDVAAINTYQLLPRVFSLEDVKTIFECLGIEELSSISLEPHPQDVPNFTQAYNFIQSSSYEANISNSYWKESVYSSNIAIQQRNGEVEYFAGAGATPDHFMPDERMEGCRYSRIEAEQMAIELAKKIAPNLSLNAKGILNGSQYVVGDTDKEIASNWDDKLVIPNSYFYVFTQNVDGIPIIPTQYQGGRALSDQNAYLPTYEDERLNIVISDNGVESIYYCTPYTVQDILQENITTLLPFDEIMQIAKSILPLKLAAQEAPGSPVNRSVSIDRITFGYMRVQTRGQTGVFQLIPVWDFFGTESNYADTWEFHRNSAIDSYLTINALDGTVMDREYSY